jgi:hypothetical protein
MSSWRCPTNAYSKVMATVCDYGRTVNGESPHSAAGSAAHPPFTMTPGDMFLSPGG